jgi:hypothetical protein
MQVSLKSGDTLTLQMIEREQVDPPAHRETTDKRIIENTERRELKRLLRNYSSRRRKPLRRKARSAK